MRQINSFSLIKRIPNSFLAAGIALALVVPPPSLPAADSDEGDLTAQENSGDILPDAAISLVDEVSDKEVVSDDESPVKMSNGPNYWATRTMDMRFGLTFHANNNFCTALHATLPFPMTWPEQTVEVTDFQMPNFAKYFVRPNIQGVGEIVIDMERMSAQDVFDVVATVRIQRSFIKKPDEPSKLQFVSRPQRDKKLSIYLGDSPYIDTTTRQVRSIANEIRDRGHPDAWTHVEAIYDWVRENIKYENGDLRSTSQALKEGVGDCEEMTGLFIAICRASDIPSRVVWVPDHCYPEFYLQDEKGNGYWFPCQIAGDRLFGEMQEYRPILQKGDRFKTPESKKFVRYLAETFTCKLRSTGPIPPAITPIRDLGPLQEELDQLRAASSLPNAGQSAAPMPDQAIEQ